MKEEVVKYSTYQQLEAWNRIVAHPTLRMCFDSELPLADAILERLTQLAEIERSVTELKAANKCIPAPRPLTRDDLSVGTIGRRVRIDDGENGSVEGILKSIRAEREFVSAYDVLQLGPAERPAGLEVCVWVGNAGRVAVASTATIEVLS